MVPIKTRKKYKISHYELNTNSVLKESMFMLFLQDIATENAEINGFGYTWTSENNLGWFLLKYRIELSYYPKNFDYIEIETMSRGINKLFAMREFTIYSPNGETIGKVMSTWALIDMNTKSMVSPLKISSNFGIYEKREDDLTFNKIHMPEIYNYEKSFDVRFDDLDINHHANNTNYISWALESLPYEYRKEHSIKNLDIQLKKDISIGETVLSKAHMDKNHTIHLIQNKNTGDELGIISIDWD